jgi:hypothetical protein
MERFSYNTWATSYDGMPAHLEGHVDRAVWAEFVNALSVLGERQATCCVQCLTCSCDEAEAKFEGGLVLLERRFGPMLGVMSFKRLEYHYQVWIPPQPAVPDHRDSDGDFVRGHPAIPGRYEGRTMEFLEVQFDDSFRGVPPIGSVPPKGFPLLPGQAPPPMMMQPVPGPPTMNPLLVPDGPVPILQPVGYAPVAGLSALPPPQ